MNASIPAAALQPVIPLASIVPSKTNPRKQFDPAKLKELAASIALQGVISPILVRPLGSDRFELVAGERRLRAAKQAGLSEIPANVRVLTDAQALELQIIENNQREDLHPLEEAEGYEALLKCAHEDGRKYTVDDIVAKIARSRSYVYQKLKLCELCDEARKAFYAGRIDFSRAILLARIAGVDLQRKALKEITEHTEWRPPMTVRQAQQHILNNYTLALDRAPFPIKDANLVPKAGACSTCPKRTGNSPELFADVKSGDVCTDPACFTAKRTAHTEALAAIAKASGRDVITGKDAKKIAPHGVGFGELKGYTSLDKEIWAGDKRKTVRQILGKDAPAKPALLEDSSTGDLVEVVKTTDIATLLKAKMKMPSSNPKIDTYAKEARAREAREKAAREVRRRIYFAAREAAGKAGIGLEDLRLVAQHSYGRLWHEHKKAIAPWWIEVEDAKGKKIDRVEALAKKIPTLAGPDLIRLVLDCALVEHVQNVSGHGSSDCGMELEALAKRHGVDVAPIKREAAAQARDKATAKKKKPAKKNAKK